MPSAASTATSTSVGVETVKLTFIAPPTFVLFADREVKLHFSFARFLENQIREAFGFAGTPIWFKVKAHNAKKNG